MGFKVLHWRFRCFSDTERKSTNKCIYACSFLVGKHCEPQSINAKLFLPIIPIGFVAYAFTLLWDNLGRNSCIRLGEEKPCESNVTWHNVPRARTQTARSRDACTNSEASVPPTGHAIENLELIYTKTEGWKTPNAACTLNGAGTKLWGFHRIPIKSPP